MADRLDEAMDELAAAARRHPAPATWADWNWKDLQTAHRALTAARQAVREARCAKCRVDSGEANASEAPAVTGQTRAWERQGSGESHPGIADSQPATVPPLPAEVRALVEELERRAGVLERYPSTLVHLEGSGATTHCNHCTPDSFTVTEDGVVREPRQYHAATLRAAIDAARRGQEGTER